MTIGNRRWWLAGVVAVAIAAGVWLLRRPGSAPSGQAPLVTLSASTSAPFVDAFDAAGNGPRLVALVSPT